MIFRSDMHLRKSAKLKPNKRQELILGYLNENPAATLDDVAAFLKVGRRWAIAELSKLHKKGHRQVEGIRL